MLGEGAVDEFTVAGGRLVGRCDLSYEFEELFKAACRKLLNSPEAELVLDITAARSLVSPYIAHIVGLHASAEQGGKVLKIIISPRMRELFEMAGLCESLSIEVAK